MKALLCACTLVACANAFAFVNSTGAPLPLPGDLNKWGEFQYVEGTQCMDGSQTGVWLRKGRDTDKVLFYFQPGGGCFNVVTCATAAADPTGKGPPGYDGIFNPDDERNALRDYSIVWVPYCSGDVFTGSSTFTIPGVGKKIFMGRTNLNLLLARVVPTFPSITNLVITGESAGGFGTLANFDHVVQAWMDGHVAPSKLVNMTLLDDSGPILADAYLAPCLQNKMREFWDLTAAVPKDCPECTGPDGGGLVNIYNFVQKKYPTAKFGLIESVRDKVISVFFGYGEKDCTALFPVAYGPTFEEGLKNVFETRLGPRFATMLFPGSQHTYTTADTYFDEVHDGVPLHVFVEKLLDGEFLKLNPWGNANVTTLSSRY